MRLLLLLSAFLTAMVGVGAPAAATPRAACEVSASASVSSVRQSASIAVVAKRTSNASARTAIGLIALHETPARSFPIYAERLRV